MMMTLAAFAVLMFDTKCPVENNSGYFTGATKSVSGVLMKEYKCPAGHTWWTRV